MQQRPGTGRHAGHRRPPERSRFRPWAIGVACALVLGGGAAAYTLTSSSSSATEARRPAPPAVTTPTAAQADQALTAFLSDWQTGRLSAAAAATDDSAGALADLTGYRSGLKPTGLTLTPGTAAATADPSLAHGLRASFKVSETVAGHSWSYDDTADVRDIGGKPTVHWTTAVLHPGLTTGQKLALGKADATTATIVDRDGRTLTAASYPSLGSVISALEKNSAKKVERAAGTGIEVEDSSGKSLRTLLTLTQPQPGTIRTTLDASLQAAAEQAIHDPHNGKKSSSVVAIDYTTGEIRALAGNAAIGGMAAPGSTMKMITSAALIDKAGASPSDAVACPKKVVINGQTIHNMDNESATGNTLIQDFAMSCNTAFIDESTSKLHLGDLHDEATKVFGLGSWSIGVPSTDPSVPVEDSTNLLAEQTIGQGNVTMNPLVIASVAATIADTGFHQPILVPGLPQVSAARPISSTTAAEIRQMMVATAQYGTAEPRMTGISGGAKTGTAETTSSTNGWFAAYDTSSHIAVGALTVGGTQGVLSAGYVARDVMLAS